MLDKIKNEFVNRYQSKPLMFSSPGRVNLIGEHTDYNNGFVLPASVSKTIYFAVSPNNKGVFRFYAHDLHEEFQTTVSDIQKQKVRWANYLLGVIAQFVQDGNVLSGFDCVFGGNVPLGAGMSSSAAIECGLAFALNTIFKLNYSTLELVKFSQKAEHEYAGVQCGIMDQFAVMHGKKDQVIMLDCNDLEYRYFPFSMENHLLVLVNTGVVHSLAASEYNIRRNECEEGVRVIQKYDNSVESLRDVTLGQLKKHRSELSQTVYNRCSYVIEENDRLQKACESLVTKDFKSFGKYMFGSHVGLRDKYEVSCPELDELVNIAVKVKGVLGARMMGGGFGGCTINLIEKSKVTDFERAIVENYKTPQGEKPQIIEVEIEDGAKQIDA